MLRIYRISKQGYYNIEAAVRKARNSRGTKQKHKELMRDISVNFAIKCYKTLHDVSTFPERHYQVRVNNEIEYIYSEKMNKLKEALKVKQRAWP